MDNCQFFILISMLAGGFGWVIMWLKSIDHRLNDLEICVTVIETILSMLGTPVKGFHTKE